MTIDHHSPQVLLALRDAGIDFDIPEIEALAVPIAAVLLIGGAFLYVRRRSASRPRRSLRATVALLAVGLVVVALLYGSTDTRRRVLIGALAIGAAGWTIAAYRTTTSGVPATVRLFLMSLRLGAVATALLILGRPVVHWTEERTIRPALAFLLDDSRSMQVRDVVAAGRTQALSRAEAVNSELTGCAARLDKLREAYDVVPFRFSAALTPEAGASPWSIRAQGDSTALGTAVAGVTEGGSSADAPLAGVFLISDGTNNVDGEIDPPGAARMLADARVPLYCVGVGSAEPRGDTRSIIGTDLRVSTRASVGTRLPIEADFECLGFANEDVRIDCFWDDARIGSVTARPGSARETVHASFVCEAKPAGFHTIEVRAAPRDASWDRDPVVISQFVRVVDDLLQILLIEAKPRVESAFIARSLAGEPRFRLTRATLARPVEGAWSNPLPRDSEQWQTFHAILLGDVQRRDLTSRQIQILRDLVTKHGTGLALIGGFENTGSRSLLTTDLDDALPIEPGPDEPLTENLLPAPTPAGRAHPVLAVNASPEDGDPWPRLPRMPGGNRFGRPKPTADILLTDAADHPLLVAATMGKGRSVALALDSTWRWAMHSDEGMAVHRKFWRQLVFWLANRRPRIHISVERPRYDLARVRPGTRGITVEAFALDGLSGLPLEGATLDARLRSPDGNETPIALEQAGDRWVQRLYPEAPGTYDLHLRAADRGEPIGESEARFVVESVDVEQRDPMANLALLQSLASTTAEFGGRYVDLSDFGRLLDDVGQDHRSRVRVSAVRQDMADELRWPALVLLCTLLGVEWIVRKRHGLV